MINKRAEINKRLLLIKAASGIYRVKMAINNPTGSYFNPDEAEWAEYFKKKTPDANIKQPTLVAGQRDAAADKLLREANATSQSITGRMTQNMGSTAMTPQSHAADGIAKNKGFWAGLKPLLKNKYVQLGGAAALGLGALGTGLYLGSRNRTPQFENPQGFQQMGYNPMAGNNSMY